MNEEIVLLREEYARLKKLETYTETRPLSRPNVKKWQAAAASAVLPLLLFAALFFPLSYAEGWVAAVLVPSSLLLIFEGYLRLCLLLCVKCYQRSAKTETRRRCKCVPSCSEYAVLALKKVFPLAIALLKIRKRLFRTCDGRDHRVDFPTKKSREAFEKTFW